MKKILLIMTAACTLMCMSACSNEDVATPLEIDTTPTAYITGYVTYVPDAVDSDDAYPSNSDVVINATATYASLGYSGSSALPLKTSYDASKGMYKIEVPASRNAASSTTVTVSVSGFAGTQLQYGSPNKIRVSGYYTPSIYGSFSVKAGQTVVGPEISYTFTAAPVQQ